MTNALSGLRQSVSTRLLVAYVACTALAVSLAAVAGANAQTTPDPTTGIDWKTDLADPAVSAIKPAIIAGLVVLVLFVAVSGGKKMWGKVTGAK